MIDLRSDTVTRPDAAMLRAMASAPLGDDVLGDDPTVRALEERAAEMLGKEAALFTPSGTMANTIAIAVHTRPGDELILEALCHSFHFECAGPSRLWGVQIRPLPGTRGQVPLEAIEAAVRSTEDIHQPRTSLVILEQTSNLAGGCVLPRSYLDDVAALCGRRGLSFHLDGARIFNAAVASGESAAAFASAADSVMFCISKGLGAPVGSLLAGTASFIAEARKVRKLLGGGLRQAGVLAACGLHALEHNVLRLADDHRRARDLAAGLADLQPRGLVVDPPPTNMVYLRFAGSRSAQEGLQDELRRQGLLSVDLGEAGVRLVFHKDIGDEDAARALEVLRSVLDRRLPRAAVSR